MDMVGIILQGVLIGGLYALVAAGLSLIFGVMRLVNIAHGDLIVLAGYLALVAVTATGLHPLIAMLLIVPVMAGIGYGLQRTLLNRTIGPDILPPLLVTFGLSVIVQNGLLEAFSADSQRLPAGTLDTLSMTLPGGIAIGVLPLAMFVVAVLLIAALQALFYRTELGRAFRATSDDRDVARLMGIDHSHVFGLAMAVALGLCAIAGVFLAMRSTFDPSIGPSRLLFAFEAVIIGGLGSLWGTLAGGVILGVAQALGAAFDPGWQLLAGHVVFLVVLVARPQGLLPRMS